MCKCASHVALKGEAIDATSSDFQKVSGKILLRNLNSHKGRGKVSSQVESSAGYFPSWKEVNSDVPEV